MSAVELVNPRSTRRPQLIGVAIVQDGDKFLVGVRTPDQVLAGMDEFPGGKCEPGESSAACAVRECFEETNQVIEPVTCLFRTEHDYPHALVEIEFYLCRLVGSSQKALPERFRWVGQRELLSLNFPDANVPVLALLANMQDDPL